MAQEQVLKFSSISEYFIDERKLLRRGENALASGDVENMTFDADLKVIRGDVHASMRQKLYNVEIYLDSQMDIEYSVCACVAGQVKGHHAAALAIHAHNNVSITDGACRWSAPAKKNSSKVMTLDEMFPLPKKFTAATREITGCDIDRLRSNLEDRSLTVGFTWLLQPNITACDLLVTDISEILFSQEYSTNDNKTEFFLNKMKISPEEILKTAKETTGQSTNPKWLVARKFRLTASNFGLVLKACQRKRYPESLFKTLMGSYDLNGVKAIMWGREHEKEALAEFVQHKGLPVEPTGLWLDSCGFIGASSDGLVGGDAVLEIKCPYKFRNCDLLTALKAEKNYILTYNTETDSFVVNKSNNIYDQIQGQLYLTNRTLCYLVIWTPLTIVIHDVYKDDDWSGSLSVLKSFYINEFIQKFIGNN